MKNNNNIKWIRVKPCDFSSEFGDAYSPNFITLRGTIVRWRYKDKIEEKFFKYPMKEKDAILYVNKLYKFGLFNFIRRLFL